MRNGMTKHRYTFVLIMFIFLLFHQLSGFLIEPVSVQFRSLSNLSDRWFAFPLPMDILLMLVFFLIWGFLFDRYSRKKLLILASLLWGMSTWLIGIAPTLATFNVSAAISGVHRASHSGIFAMLGDLFKPTNRGKIFGLLLLTLPLSFIFGRMWSQALLELINWRVIMLLLGAIGLTLSLAMHFFVREPKRGAREPALQGIQLMGTYKFDWENAKTTLKKPSLLLIFAINLIGIIPLIVLPEGLFIYLNEVHGLPASQIYLNLTPTLVGITLGYPLGGMLGDLLFRFKKLGRIFMCLFGLVLPCVCLYSAIIVQDIQGQGFLVCMLLLGVSMSFTWPNLMASLLDITLPELRASTIGIALLLQAIGPLISPLILAGVQKQIGIGLAILWICIGSWSISSVFTLGLMRSIPQDFEQLRRHMAYRSHLEARLERS